MAHSIMTEVTKERMAHSLKKKMAQKPLNKITIREIVEDCGLNRQTFYYHFHDIYDLVEWMFSEEAVDILKQTVTYHTWQEACLNLLYYIEDNKAVCLCALNSMGRSPLETFFYKNLRGLFCKLVDEASAELPIAPEYRDFLVHYYTTLFAGMLISWLRGEMKATPEKTIEMLSMTMSDHIREAVSRFAEKGSLLSD